MQPGSPCFEVIGVDLPTATGKDAVAAVNNGRLQVVSSDGNLQRGLEECRRRGNISATTDESVYERADVVLVDIHLDLQINAEQQPHVDFTGFRKAIRSLGQRLKPGALIIVETTVPPGTCERIVQPELAAALEARGLPADAILLAHSYERVMPGKDYLNSITNFWRVYSGTTPAAAAACERFLSRVINVKDYPLTRLHSTTASETAKVLENSYRATNIAFIHEWGEFAERAGIDMFAILEAIRVRPTHSNIRQPGFGVGGYCLTKDPAFAMVSASQLLGLPELDFPFSRLAMQTNAAMPLHSVRVLAAAMGGTLAGMRILMLGVTYREDVGDTRYSAAETFARAAEEAGAQVLAHDPLLNFWPELDRSLPPELPQPRDVDAVVFTVAHRAYTELDVVSWLGSARPVILRYQPRADIGAGSGGARRGTRSALCREGRLMAKILVTGGAGFIGLHLAQALVARGDRVDLLDNFGRGVRDAPLGQFLAQPGVRMLELNLLDADAVGRLDRDYDAIVHFAAIIGVATCCNGPTRCWRTIAGCSPTQSAWRAPRKTCTRFVFASTSEVYAGTLSSFGMTILDARGDAADGLGLVAPANFVHAFQDLRRGNVPAIAAALHHCPAAQRLRPENGHVRTWCRSC